MKKLFQLFTKGQTYANYIALAGLFAFILLNLAGFIEYAKYLLGMSNNFYNVLPAFRLLLKIDFLFIAALILMYNAVEKFVKPILLLVGILLTILTSILYFIVKDMPMVIFGIIGLYGLGIFLYASIIGFGLLLPPNSNRKEVNYEK